MEEVVTWILVWWLILPGHTPKIHIEHYDTEQRCFDVGTALESPLLKVRWHCSEE